MLSSNLIVQALTLLSGLLVNFLFPVAFGLEAYGRFLQTLLATFVLQRLVDGASEPLIALCTGERIFTMALLANGAIAIVLAGATVLIGVKGLDLVLLATMVLTSTVLLALHRNRMQRSLIAYLSAFVVAFVALTALARNRPEAVSLRDVLLWTNAASALLGLVLLGSSGRIRIDPRTFGRTLGSIATLMPRAVSSSLVANVLTTAYLLVCGYVLPARELAMLRVGTSIVQSATSLYPANMKAIFVAMGEDGAAQRLRDVLRASFWLFLTVASAVVGAVLLRTQPVPGASLAFVAIPYFWAMCIERYLLMTRHAGALRVLNLVVAPTVLGAAYLFVASLDDALRFYAYAVAGWCVLLAFLARSAVAAAALSAIVALAIAGLVGMQHHPIAGPTAAATLVVLGAAMLRPDRRTLSMLRGRL